MGRDAYSALVSGVIFPLHEILKGHDTGRRLRELERSQWWDRATLEAFQLALLREFLGTAGSHVPYYRDLFRHIGFDPASIQSVGDLTRLPILTKSEIRGHHAAFLREGARGLTTYSTGGSTGEPLQFFVGPGRISADVASRRRAMRWWGIDIGDPEVVLWGSPIEITRQDRIRAIRDRLFRSTLLSAAGMTGPRMDGYLDTLVRAQPAHIFSHASVLCELAAHAERTGRSLSALGIRVVFVTSEELYDHQRQQLERIFGCPVANGYGGRDAGFVSQECPRGGMHVSAEDVVIEIVDDHGAPLPRGCAGEIIVTNLASGDFPFVRYDTGDVGVLDDAPCACGRGLPLLR
ncbi:MAG: phenylacetate--CoA ligase family protein [Candidatus Eisenbacteria bacterium]